MLKLKSRKKNKSELLTVTAVSHLQVLVDAITWVSKHRAAHFDSTATFPVTAVDSGKSELAEANYML